MVRGEGGGMDDGCGLVVLVVVKSVVAASAAKHIRHLMGCTRSKKSFVSRELLRVMSIAIALHILLGTRTP